MSRLPPRLASIVAGFAASPKQFRVEALLDFSRRLPPLPASYAEHRDRLQPVPECQTPFYLAAEVDDEGGVTLYFDAPPESPTVRGFAGILAAGLAGATAEEILAIPADFYLGMGLEEVVTPLRLRGMGAILARLKRILSSGSAEGAPA